MMRSSQLAGLIVLLLVAAMQAPSTGQEATKRAKPRGRLPAYYADVVSAVQREQIYKIQGTYADQLEKLKAEIKTLEDKRDAEVEAVLTPEQRDMVAKKRAEAAAKRAGVKEEAPAGTAAETKSATDAE